MNTMTALRAGTATHAGRLRSGNEDRVFADTASGLFLVVDGMGGHAAGGTAAEIAVAAVREQLREAGSGNETRVRRAIAAANNRILEAAQARPEWQGMACVLTLALVENNQLCWGHVGDSRLYLFSDGTLCKLTPDHSPIGEKEDRGELDEREAMRHPLRNRVSRDVGLEFRAADDPDFIETASLPFPPEAALLLCSDGLSDSLTARQITSVLEEFNGDPDRTAGQLVEAANEQRGADNVSVILVTGADFERRHRERLAKLRERHSITRVRGKSERIRLRSRYVWLLIGLVCGALLAFAWESRAELKAAASSFAVHNKVGVGRR